MDFQFGQFFTQKEIWNSLIDLVRSRGGHVPTFIQQAVTNTGVDPHHPDFTNLKRRNIKFRGRFFDDYDSLVAADIPNSPSIAEFESDVKVEIWRLVSRGAVRFISEAEALSTGSIINPLQWERCHKADGSIKSRLIIHGKLNCFYSRPRFSLADIGDECQVMAKFSELVVTDQEDCFYQMPVVEHARKKLRFKVQFEGEEVLYGEFLVLGMGLSGSPFCVQSANRLLVEAYSIKYDVYAEVYIDDIWSSTKSGVPHFDDFTRPLGVRFKDSKKSIGSQLTILGIKIDLTKKTATITDAKASILALEAARLGAGEFVSPHDLSSFLGRAEFCCKVTSLGRVFSAELVKIFGQFAADGGDVSSEEKMIELTEQAVLELAWWKNIKGWLG